MESKNTIQYDVGESSRRIDMILETNNANFTCKDRVPSRTSLNYTNGYYVNVTALFIDIAGSSDMTDKHKRAALAKIYRCFISECVAIMNSESICKEISINGDCVWGVFDTPKNNDIDTVIDVAAKLSSMIKILNYKLRKKNYSEISVRIGIDCGRALMVKAGYSESGINDVIWMGDVVNSACHICNGVGRNYTGQVVISKAIYDKLNQYNQGLFLRTSVINRRANGWSTCNSVTYYHGDKINTYMNNWYKKHCK